MIYEFVKLLLLSPRSKRLNFITGVACLGLMVGVCSFNVVMTVFQSFQIEMKSIIRSFHPDILILSQNKIIHEKFLEKEIKPFKDQIKSIEPFYYTETLLSFKDQTHIIYLKTISQEKQNPYLKADLVSSCSKPCLLLGKDFSTNLGVQLHDEITLLKQGEPLEGVRFEVVGFLETGLSQFDGVYGFMTKKALQAFLPQEQIMGYEVMLYKPDEANMIAAELNKTLPYFIEPWEKANSTLIDQAKKDGLIVECLVSLISFVAGLNILIILIVGVFDRGRQFALLRAFGASRRQFLKAFVLYGSLVGLIGGGAGIVLSIILLEIFSRITLGDLKTFYFFDSLPVHYDFKLFLLSLIVSIFISLLSTLYPAWRATKIDPIAWLRRE